MRVIKPDTTVEITVTNPGVIALVQYEAVHAEMGGESSVYENHVQRIENLPEDQLTGQAGNFALHQLVFKEEYCVGLYKKSRAPFHINPRRGDNGMDIIDTHIDVKNSFTLSRTEKETVYINDYNLIVRPREFYLDWVYVAALSEKLDNDELKTYLIGWAWSSDFPKEVNKSGKLSGAYTIRHNRVRVFPLPNIFPDSLQPYLREGVVEGV
jgi:hypothetical protein